MVKNGFLVCLLTLSSLIISCKKNSSIHPNIVFIMADDLGYADLSSYGSDFINTPHLDKMALNGAKLTSYYSPQAVCSASRAAVLTGAYSNSGIWSGTGRYKKVKS